MLNRFMNSGNGFLAVFLMVTGVLVLSSFWVITFVYSVASEDDEEMVVDEAMSAIYVNYYNSASDYVSAESYLAMGQYQTEYFEPQNVQVLVGLNTQGVIGYMLNHMSAGMGVDCTHCHTLENFAADEWDDEVAMANKVTARAHLGMVEDLNENWLSQLPDLTDNKQPSGAQISCATCHNGVAVPNPWPEDDDIGENLRLPLGEDVVYSVEEEGILNVNARDDISLDTVQYNQEVMYHMNTSLGVGCTHCHNSRYFPSYEVAAKYYSLNMLQMTQHLWQNYSEVLNDSEPSCSLCHQGAAIPPGSVRSADVMPDSIDSVPD